MMDLTYFIKKNSSTILSITASVGVILTAISTAKAAIKAKEVVDNSWKVWVPPIMFGSGTIACILGANVLNTRSQAALISAYQLLNQTYKDYVEHTKLVFGEDADKKIQRSIMDERRIINTSEQETTTLFYDMYTKKYFYSTMAKVYKAEYEINRIYSKFGYVCLQEFYDAIGIRNDENYYECVGWSKEAGEAMYGYDCIDIEHEQCVLEDNLQCCIIWYPYPPSTDFLYY